MGQLILCSDCLTETRRSGFDQGEIKEMQGLSITKNSLVDASRSGICSIESPVYLCNPSNQKHEDDGLP